MLVGSAPALFVISCGDERCRDGGYDITRAVMGALHARQGSAQGDHECDGHVGSGNCTRRIAFELAAEYLPAN